ncbi:nuclear transport factor 2 family protein [Streptomyces sp. MZ04]|uniref:nuclear transport factor 2 family protein n=1 Tax=Streptomyces sp. MZ04 TaxID=2559236 RepID=UPI00107EAD1E|nr:nuclear transport factor 2 family protein [Streptomyces sp. MZ04]TGB14909.1 nuclear transport factor 2 family protein [Streptomyces sp. MZ04]
MTHAVQHAGPHPSPPEVLSHSLDLLLAKDIDGWVALWAPDGVFEFPFALPGTPHRLVGREAVRGYMADYPDHIDLRGFEDLTVHRTEDPETIVVELRGLGRAVATGRPFDMPYIQVVTVHDGLITRFRDYWNGALVADAFDGEIPVGGTRTGESR